jgi:hypothetical protein
MPHPARDDKLRRDRRIDRLTLVAFMITAVGFTLGVVFDNDDTVEHICAVVVFFKAGPVFVIGRGYMSGDAGARDGRTVWRTGAVCSNSA